MQSLFFFCLREQRAENKKSVSEHEVEKKCSYSKTNKDKRPDKQNHRNHKWIIKLYNIILILIGC